MRSMNRRWKALGLGALASLALLEVCGRVWLGAFASNNDFTRYAPPAWVPLEQQRYLPHPYTAYTMNPAFRGRDGRNRHNALGYRGAEVALEKAPGTYRILCLGGSTTYETGVPEFGRTWPAQMQEILRQRLGRDNVEVINAGCPQWNSWESLIDLQLRGLQLEPDLVIVYCGTNEIFPRLVPPQEYRRDNRGYRKGWEAEWSWWQHSVGMHFLGLASGLVRRTSLSEMCEIDYGDLDREACLTANTTRYYEDNLEQMVALTRQYGAKILISTWAWCGDFEDDYASDPVFQRGFRETNEASRRVADELSVPLYDHASEMPTDRKWWHDGRHVNTEGARRKAELFAEFVATQILTRT